MIRNTVLTGLVLCLFTAPAFANGASREEGAGVGIGVIVGGAAGGPFGALVGAAIGAKLGDNYHQRKEEVASLSTSLTGSQDQVSTLERDIHALNTEIQEVRDISKPELLMLLQAGIEMDLLFRTDEHVLSDSTGTRLQQLATSLVANPDIEIRLDGFADERGNEKYNQELSVRRAEYVRDLLVGNGIPESRITVNAFGESPAAEQNADSFALERRVSLTLHIGDTPSLASNPL